MDLIYCAGKNERLSQIAYDAGWMLGMRSDVSSSFPPCFLDVNYKRPDFARHLGQVANHRPKYAVVPDLSSQVVCKYDIERAVQQAEQLQAYSEVVLIVPKLPGQIAHLPSQIALGYSVRSSYGGAHIPLWEFVGRRVHLLGGSPQRQMQVYLYLSAIADVISADGNMAQKMATRLAKFWEQGKWMAHPQRLTHTSDLYLDCWKRSCVNIRAAWLHLIGEKQTMEVA